MQKQELVEMMLELLQDVLDENDEGEGLEAALQAPLVGPEAIVTSMSLVSFITDVELAIDDTWNSELMLVNEKALSREKSPFRSIDALSDYVLELAAEQAT